MKRQRDDMSEPGPNKEDNEACRDPCGQDDSEGEDDELEICLDDFGRIAGVGEGLDFSSRSAVILGDSSASEIREAALELDRLDRKEELDASFWLPATLLDSPAECSELCLLERYVIEVFEMHTRGVAFESVKSGAEWWVQVRDNKVVEYSRGGEEEDDEEHGPSIQFHFDKDEVLQAQFQVMCTPQISTVTYLTDHGAPTVVLDKVSDADGSVEPGPVQTGFVSYPRVGKHLSFDGRLLHAAPAELSAPSSPVASSCRRVTLLINIWLNHPFGCPLEIEALPRGISNRIKTPAAATERQCWQLKTPTWTSGAAVHV